MTCKITRFYRLIKFLRNYCNKDKKSGADKKVCNNKSPINFFTRVKNWILGINEP